MLELESAKRSLERKHIVELEEKANVNTNKRDQILEINGIRVPWVVYDRNNIVGIENPRVPKD